MKCSLLAVAGPRQPVLALLVAWGWGAAKARHAEALCSFPGGCRSPPPRRRGRGGATRECFGAARPAQLANLTTSLGRVPAGHGGVCTRLAPPRRALPTRRRHRVGSDHSGRAFRDGREKHPALLSEREVPRSKFPGPFFQTRAARVPRQRRVRECTTRRAARRRTNCQTNLCAAAPSQRPRGAALNY